MFPGREVRSRRAEAPLLLLLLLLLQPCAADYCSWKGSGLSWDPHPRAVEQVHLRCTEGFLEWMYPARALRVVLEPNLSSVRHSTVCIKPSSSFQGASIYVERDGHLHLLVSEAEERRPHHVSCFSTPTLQRVALFLQASPQRDISRKTASFQYELLNNQSATGPDFQKMALVEAMCRPCDHMELLMAICSSDFGKSTLRNFTMLEYTDSSFEGNDTGARTLPGDLLFCPSWVPADVLYFKSQYPQAQLEGTRLDKAVVRGSIQNVTHDAENHMSQVDVGVRRVYRQKNRVFQHDEATGEWQGPIKTLLQCKVKKGPGDFLFTGSEHFGEAWLGCAPRFKDFSAVYQAARERGANPCEFQFE